MSTRRALGEVTFNLENEDDKENLLMKPLRTPVVASYDDDELEDATPFSEAPETPADDKEVEEEEEEAVVESPAASPSEWDLLVNEASVRVGAAVSRLRPARASAPSRRAGLTALNLVAAAAAVVPFLCLTVMWTWRQIAVAAVGGAYPAFRTAKLLVEVEAAAPDPAEVKQWAAYWLFCSASLALRHTVGLSLLPPVFYVKALLGWLPKEACMALVATGKKVRRRMSACFSPSPVSFEEIHAD
ncbi:hypothetical protein JL720_7044 [Aureococcus anophagefferens]|nr:hypothetical protein JL720_7044 [Aureococcus anophagefferens]